jgi:hypothetical protein
MDRTASTATRRVAPEVANYKWPVRQMCYGMLFLLAVGCSQSGPKLAPVQARVTLDGRPLNTVDVVFQPRDGGRPGTARTDADGHYELTYKRGSMGARVGEHTVRIGYTSNIVPNPPKIPARYNTASELRAEVKPGQNEFNFDLKSDAK